MVQAVPADIPKQVIKEDVLASLIGHFGRWQLMICLTIPIIKFSSGWVQMAIVFLTPKTTFWCTDFGDNSTRIGDNMTCYDECAKYSYDASPFNNTIISEWDLVCERSWLTSLTQMMLQLGVLLGSILFGFFSDRYGRRKTLLLSVVGLIVFGFAVSFSPDYITFTTLRFLLGVATAGTMVVSFVLIMETIGPKYREVCGCLFQLPFIIGHATMPIFAFYNRSWDSYSLAMAVPPLIYLVFFFTAPESPRWLISMGKTDQASRVVTKVAEMNKLPTTKVEETIKSLSEEIRSKATTVKPHYGDLFRGSLMIKTISSCVIWMITGLTYYGFNQYVSQTSPNPFITVAAAGLIQIPSIFISIVLLKYFGRKTTIVTFFVLGGLFVLVLGLVSGSFWTNLTLACVGISCVSVVCTCVYIYTSELFPTVVRNMSMGACSTCMRIGSMIAPFISNLSETVPWMPTVIFGFAPLLGALICLMLPETKGTTLQDVIDSKEEQKT
ncbi:solute carrier family 22 member 6-A-like [Danaus plexippus]|uniref:solute carrier family 22 member 6-A-like n=1 Tax=Danaus plexippus TaxID=13037 RepID=UPI002AAFE146|nr:solute carrier family 22 member 6-A-like [Danaus plexippus]